MGEVWDCVVVGAGIVGSWTAYHLNKNGHKTLLLEQFSLPHTRGSTSGQTRIFRKYYTEELYCLMVGEAIGLWNTLEKEADTSLMRVTGILAVDGMKASKLEKSVEVMEKLGMSYERLSPQQLRERYPEFRFTDNYQGVLDKEGGVFRAAKGLSCVQEVFKRNGGKIHDGAKVKSVKSQGNQVSIETDRQTYRARKVVLCPGPWAKELLQSTGLHLPLVTMPGYQYYFKARDPQKMAIESGLPIMLHDVELDEGYQFIITKPMYEYPGLLKVASRGQPFLDYCHPDERDRQESRVRHYIEDYVAKHLPYVDPTPCLMDPGVYTMTPDRDYIIDKHPSMQNVFIGAGCSGHGFKTSPVIGKILCEMVEGKPHSYDLTKFKVTRFKETGKSML